MPPKSTLEVKFHAPRGRSPSRSPKPRHRKKIVSESSSYGSEGVKDNDIFSLPTSDFKAMALLTLIASIVRLFRIYQPSSVVFDEVQ